MSRILIPWPIEARPCRQSGRPAILAPYTGCPKNARFLDWDCVSELFSPSTWRHVCTNRFINDASIYNHERASCGTRLLVLNGSLCCAVMNCSDVRFVFCRIFTAALLPTRPGTIPIELGEMKALSILNLRDNNLSGGPRGHLTHATGCFVKKASLSSTAGVRSTL